MLASYGYAQNPDALEPTSTYFKPHLFAPHVNPGRTSSF